MRDPPIVWQEVERDVKFFYLLYLLAEENGYQNVQRFSWKQIRKAMDLITPLQERFLSTALEGLIPMADGQIQLPTLSIDIHNNERGGEIYVTINCEEESELRRKKYYIAYLIRTFRRFLSGRWGGSSQRVYSYHKI